MTTATLSRPLDTALSTAPARRASVWIGRALTGLLATFLVFDAVCKLVRVPAVVEASARLGFGEGAIVGIGAVLLASVILHLVPRTAVVGAVLLTGYLGGAVCTHVHARDGAFPIVFAVTFGALVWLGLYLRDPRVGAMLRPPA